MYDATRVVKCLSVACLALVFGAISGPVRAASPTDRGGAVYAEASMQVQTEGLTVDELLQRQAELSRRLLGELPAAALETPARVALSREEIGAVEGLPSSTSPLKIGVVKPLTTGIDVAGMDIESAERSVRRGALGQAYLLPDGGAVWAQVVKAEGAGALRLHVEAFSLPPGAEMYFYSRRGEAFGPYKDFGPEGTGDFWTTSVFGNEGILQVRFAGPVDAATLKSASFRVAEAGMITPRFTARFVETPEAPTAFCGNAACIVDASCYNVAAANPAKDAVAKMEWVAGAFIYTCTGGLIADNNPNQNNYFLTANHCFSKAPSGLTFYWRFRTSSCNGSCPSNNGWPYKTTGGAVRATNRKGDFTLGQLTSAPPAGSVFLGWTSAPVANTNNLQLYRISNPQFGPQVYSQHNVDTSKPTCTGWPRGERIYSRDITGATDGGSSGSPVINGSSQIVGQLSGACGTNVNDVCDAGANATVDGAFAYYYATVQPFLAP